MPRPILLKSAAELLKLILDGNRPADTQMERYFRAHPGMGVRDRGFVAETVYGCLRRRRLLEHLAGEAAPDLMDLVAAYLLTAAGWSARVLQETGYRGDAAALAARARGLDINVLPFAVRADLPDWLAERLRAQLGDDETLRLAAALNQPAPVDLRVNTLKTKREEVRARLTEEGYPSEPTPLSPVGLRRRERSPLFNTRCFRDGLFEVQDEGSQLLSFLLEPRRGEMVVDFCAGAGGKTLHLGALMANTGTLYAFDISAKRLDRLKPRLRRAGLGNVRAVVIDDERDDRVRRLHGKIDRVLVDAPCSGAGTLRRNPDVKWRPLDLPELTGTQKRILAGAARLMKRGGRLVYSTCSLLREENEDIVQNFLAENPGFRVLPATDILARREISVELSGDALRLYPHIHHTDGFYAVALERAD